jgi:hypothetical protein
METLFWALLAALVVAAVLRTRRRRARYESVDDEPWRASLRDDDEEIDHDELRRAERELRAAEEGEEDEDAEPWR